MNDSSDKAFHKALDGVAGLKKLVESTLKVSGKDIYTYMELALHGLSEFDVINKDMLESKLSFRDLLADMLNDDLFDEN